MKGGRIKTQRLAGWEHEVMVSMAGSEGIRVGFSGDGAVNEAMRDGGGEEDV